MDRLSSDDLLHFRAAIKAKAAAEACWSMTLSVLIPKYNLTNQDAIDDDTGIITRTQQPVALQTVQPNETP